MKLNFWAVSRKTNKKLKLFLVVVSLAGGILAAAESRYAFLRLYGIEIDPRGMIPENAV